MSSYSFGGVPPLRRRLAKRLTDLRRGAGLNSVTLAGKLGTSQATVSRIENAGQPASREFVQAWCSAVGASPEATADLLELADAVATEVIEWRKAARSGFQRLQRDIRAVELASTSIHQYAPLLIPGLLQTADVARHVFESLQPEMGARDIAEGVAARLERQDVLLDPSKRIEFILTEASLRWRIASPRMMATQIERISHVAGLGHVHVSIIPMASDAPAWPAHGFAIHDADPPMVFVETLTTGLTITEPADLKTYREAFDRLRRLVVADDGAARLLDEVTRSYTR